MVAMAESSSMAATVLKQRYEIVREVGRGGFGQTFLAVDRCVSPGRYCAIKQLQPILSKPQQFQWVRDRFGREAAVLAQLGTNHHQIPHFYDHFSEAGNFYLVQEWIEGTTLTQRVRQEGPLGPQAVASLLAKLLPVLTHLHENRTIHRDIKPDNIILRAGSGQPVLIDFGAVKEVMALNPNGRSAVTGTVAIGTPGYMAPEQAAGRPVYASDLYALAMTALFLLTRRSPQEMADDPRTGEILWQREIPHVRGPLAEALAGALRFHPRERFESAAEMLATLQGNRTGAFSGGAAALLGRASGRRQATPQTLAAPLTAPATSNHFRSFLLAAVATATTAAGIGFATIRLLQTPDSDNPDRQQPVASTRPPAASPEPVRPDLESRSEEPTIEPLPEATEGPETDVADLFIKTEEPASPAPLEPMRESRPAPAARPNTIAFAPGRSGRDLRDRLGQPTATRQGRLPGTRELRYDNAIPGQVDLVYLEDTRTQELRFSQAQLAAGARLEVAEELLAQLLNGRLDPSIRSVLRDVMRGKDDVRSFQTQAVYGTIQRLPDRRLVLSINPK